MIISRLNGGLGNQLFQYAFGRALSLELRTELALDTSLLQTISKSTTRRDFALDVFAIQARTATAAESLKCRRAVRFGPLAKWATGFSVLKESPANYPVALKEVRDNTALAGYWQSETCFGAHATPIGKELAPNRELSLRSGALVRDITIGSSVAVHVRRGDYVSLPAAARFHGTLPISYYQKAARRVIDQESQPLWVVFSDDVQWCRDALKFPQGEVLFVDHNQGADAWQDLYLMSLCKHHIIANSSFSWWGAWLSEQRGYANQMIHAPTHWFNRGDPYARFRIPQRWARV